MGAQPWQRRDRSHPMHSGCNQAATRLQPGCNPLCERGCGRGCAGCGRMGAGGPGRSAIAARPAVPRRPTVGPTPTLCEGRSAPSARCAVDPRRKASRPRRHRPRPGPRRHRCRQRARRCRTAAPPGGSQPRPGGGSARPTHRASSEGRGRERSRARRDARRRRPARRPRRPTARASLCSGPTAAHARRLVGRRARVATLGRHKGASHRAASLRHPSNEGAPLGVGGLTLSKPAGLWCGEWPHRQR